MLKAKDLRDIAIEELQVTYSDHRKKLFTLVNECKQEKKSEKPHLIRQTKKEIARLLTVISQKQLANQQSY